VLALVSSMLRTTVRQVVPGKGFVLALLASLGVLPLACGGTSSRHNADDNGDSGSAGTSGSSSVAGQHATAGATATAGRDGGGVAGSGEVIGGTGGGPRKIVCTSPKQDPVTGLVTCSEGYSHRPVAIACGSAALGGAGGEGGVGSDAAGEGGAGGADPNRLPRLPAEVEGNLVLCAEDPSACDAYQYGYCRQYRLGKACYSGCVTDQDCGSGAVCLCDDPASPTGGRCHPSGCVTDQDCQPGYTCASHRGPCDETVPYACQKPEDTCEVDADCAEEGVQAGFGQVCRIQSDGRRACEPLSVCN
jgi:hypothetical protein